MQNCLTSSDYLRVCFLQLPRLTQMLRASVLGGQNTVDVSEMYRHRSNSLRQRVGAADGQVLISPQLGIKLHPMHNVVPALQTSGPGTSKLAQRLIGPWAKAPKAAKQDYEKFVKAVLVCLGGEPSSAEVLEASTGVWNALQSAPPPEKLQQSRLSAINALKPYR